MFFDEKPDFPPFFGSYGAQSRNFTSSVPSVSKDSESDLESNADSTEENSKVSSKSKSKKNSVASVSISRRSGRTVKAVDRMNISSTSSKSYKKLELIAHIFDRMMA